MNKYKLRHRILEEIYKAPDNPEDKKYDHWIHYETLKRRIIGLYKDKELRNEIEFLYGAKEIVKTKYMNTDNHGLNREKSGVQKYLDNFYLDKSKNYWRETVQYRLKVTAWTLGIILGSATFGLNLYKLSLDIYSIERLENRVKTLEQQITPKQLPNKDKSAPNQSE